MKRLLALLLFSAPLLAQSTPLVFDQPIQAPSISTALLTLTGGTAYPAGLYLVNLDDTGKLTYTPYAASSGTVIGTSIAVPARSIGTMAITTNYTLAGTPAHPTPAVLFLDTSIDPIQNGIRFTPRITAANTISVTITNATGSTHTIPAYTLYLSVSK